MKSLNSWPWQRKSILYLIFAALCVAWTGFTFNSEISIFQFLVTSLITVTLVLFVYGFDDLMDIEGVFHFFKNPHLRWVMAATLIAVLGALLFLGTISFMASTAILLIGILYSFRYKKDSLSIRLKSYFFLKNFLIGLGWGLLVFLGSNKYDTSTVIVTFSFFTLQVIVGSIIRDLDDIDEDIKNHIPTFPIVLGLKNTSTALHILNILSGITLGLAVIYIPEYQTLWALWSIIVIYRFGLIEVIRNKHDRSYLLQQVNILACSLVFVGRMADLWIF